MGSQALAVTAFERPPGGWLDRSLGLSVTTEYFTTKANYESARGSYTRLTGDNKFSSLDTKFRARYSFSRELSAFGGFGLGYSQATDATFQKSNSQISEIFGGLNFLLHRKYLHVVPEVIVSAPINATSPVQTAPMTSDGVPYLRTGLFVHKPYRYFRFGAFGGFHVPLSDLGTRLVYELTVDARVFSIVTIGGGINGYETFLSDNGSLASRRQTAALANAGSQRYYAFEPALIEARGWVGFRPDRTLWIRVGAAKTLNGTNTAEGLALTASITYNSPRLFGTAPSTETRSSQPRTARPDEDSARKKFVPESETTEQDIFDSEEEEVLPRTKKDELDQTEKLLEKKARQSP